LEKGTKSYNYDKTGANFQVAALVPNILCKFCLQKIMKLLITPRPLKLEETISADTEHLNFQNFFGARYAKFRTNQNILSI
jgi:hypothetical protein